MGVLLEAGDGRRRAQLLEDARVDLVLSDINMPGMGRGRADQAAWRAMKTCIGFR